MNDTGNATTWIAFDETVTLFKLMHDSEYICVWQIAYALFVFVFVLVSPYLSPRLPVYIAMSERRA